MVNVNTPLIGVTISIIILLLIAAAWVSGFGGLKSDVAHLKSDVAHLTNRVDILEREMLDGFDRMEQEIRTSKVEVITAIAEHEHDSGGKVVFRRPP